MQNAKRMVLVDEKFLEEIYQKNINKWKRPIDIKVKSTLDRQMKSELDDDTIADDLKVKQYNRDLSRFLNTRKKLLDQTSFLPDESLLLPSQQQPKQEQPTQEEQPKQEQSKQEALSIASPIKEDVIKTERKKRKPSFPTWHRKRAIKIPTKLNWESW